MSLGLGGPRGRGGEGGRQRETQSPWEPEASSGGREKPRGGDEAEGVKAKGKWVHGRMRPNIRDRRMKTPAPCSRGGGFCGMKQRLRSRLWAGQEKKRQQ